MNPRHNQKQLYQTGNSKSYSRQSKMSNQDITGVMNDPQHSRHNSQMAVKALPAADAVVNNEMSSSVKNVNL